LPGGPGDGPDAFHAGPSVRDCRAAAHSPRPLRPRPGGGVPDLWRLDLLGTRRARRGPRPDAAGPGPRPRGGAALWRGDGAVSSDPALPPAGGQPGRAGPDRGPQHTGDGPRAGYLWDVRHVPARLDPGRPGTV